MSAPAPSPSPPVGAAPEPAPMELTEFFCYECESSVSLPVAAAHPMARRPPCPLCRGNFLEPGPSPFPELDPAPPPEDSDGRMDIDVDELDQLDEIEMMAPAEARLYITRFIQDRLNAVAAPEDIALATAAAMSLLDDHIPGAGGEPPALVASIAVLPTVEVSDPDAICAICLEDLRPAALKLPCSHLYHSCCVVPWLQRHDSCPMCRSRLPVADPLGASPSEQDLQTTITIRLTTTGRRRVRVNDGAMFAEAPVSESPTQLAQAVAGEAGDGPANSSETVSSDWPPQPESDAVMSEARSGDSFSD